MVANKAHSDEQKQTEGVKLLLGDPKKAILRLSIPIIIGMLIQTLYNLIDAIWITGKGADALSAIGFFFPISLLITAIGSGIGIGTSSGIAKYIGSNSRQAANQLANHAVLLTAAIAIFLTIPSTIFIEPMFKAIGAGSALKDSMAYGRIMLLGMILIMFSTVGSSILSGEGDTKRVMKVFILGPVINIVLAPILIYKFEIFNTGLVFGFDMGIQGAALATVIANFAICSILFYWLFISKHTFLAINFRRFKYDGNAIKAIIKIGLPACLSQMSMSILMTILTMFVSTIDQDTGVAVFTAGWRFGQMAVIPLFGMSNAIITVIGAACGAGDMEKAEKAYLYAIKMGIVIEGIIALVTFLFAHYFAQVFAGSKETSELTPQIEQFLKTLCLFFPLSAAGTLTGAMFQGAGRGFYSLVITFLRQIIINVPLAFVFGIALDMGIAGINYGVVLGTLLASSVSLIWARLFIRNQINLKLLTQQNKIYKTEL